MDWSTIESRWDDFKASAKLRWGKLSVAQVNGAAGKRDDLALRLQAAYSLSKEEAERQISEWQAKLPQNPVPVGER